QNIDQRRGAYGKRWLRRYGLIAKFSLTLLGLSKDLLPPRRKVDFIPDADISGHKVSIVSEGQGKSKGHLLRSCGRAGKTKGMVNGIGSDTDRCSLGLNYSMRSGKLLCCKIRKGLRGIRLLASGN